MTSMKNLLSFAAPAALVFAVQVCSIDAVMAMDGKDDQQHGSAGAQRPAPAAVQEQPAAAATASAAGQAGASEDPDVQAALSMLASSSSSNAPSSSPAEPDALEAERQAEIDGLKRTSKAQVAEIAELEAAMQQLTGLLGQLDAKKKAARAEATQTQEALQKKEAANKTLLDLIRNNTDKAAAAQRARDEEAAKARAARIADEKAAKAAADERARKLKEMMDRASALVSPVKGAPPAAGK